MSRTAIMIRYAFMPFPCDSPSASMIAYSAGSFSAISPCQASDVVERPPLNAAAATEPSA